MKYLKLFEGFDPLNIHLISTAHFSKLPLPYQIAIVIRAFEVNEDVDWSIDEEPDWVNDKDKVKILIDDYTNYCSLPHKNLMYKWGNIPTDLLVKRILESDEFSGQGIETVEDFYNWYHAKDVEDHGKSIIPIIIDDDEESYIEDGWHRLNYYLKIKLKVIPAVGVVDII